MKDIEKELYLSCLSRFGFIRNDQAVMETDSGWTQFDAKPETGTGFYRYYIDSNLFAISVFDFLLKQDLIQTFHYPEFISLSYYDSVSGEIQEPYSETLKPHFHACVANNIPGRAIMHKGVPIRGITINIMPEYYTDYLYARYPDGYENPSNIFADIREISDFPELLLLVRQIRSCRATGISARLYYYSKVAECMSLIIEKAATLERKPSKTHVCQQDQKNLQAVVRYIELNLSRKIRLEELARIARMGTTKLKYTFKEVYQSTISSFIQDRRMSRAERLLSGSDLNISQISQMVGYKKAGSFSETFRKRAGLLPNEYRRLTLSTDSMENISGRFP